jgi:hypothetical protein
MTVVCSPGYFWPEKYMSLKAILQSQPQNENICEFYQSVLYTYMKRL